MKMIDNRKAKVRDIQDGDLVMYEGKICIVIPIYGDHHIYNLAEGKQETWYSFLSDLNENNEIELLTDVYDINITISNKGAN